MSHLLSPVACMLQAHASRPSLMTPPIFRYATLNGCEIDQLCCCHKSAAEVLLQLLGVPIRHPASQRALSRVGRSASNCLSES